MEFDMEKVRVLLLATSLQLSLSLAGFGVPSKLNDRLNWLVSRADSINSLLVGYSQGYKAETSLEIPARVARTVALQASPKFIASIYSLREKFNTRSAIGSFSPYKLYTYTEVLFLRAHMESPYQAVATAFNQAVHPELVAGASVGVALGYLKAEADRTQQQIAHEQMPSAITGYGSYL